MRTSELGRSLAILFSELVEGAHNEAGAFILNSGDPGLLQSLATLPADEASRPVNGGATIAAHAEHVRYGLSLMNRWASEGGDPFAEATWDAAWRTVGVDTVRWQEIRDGLQHEARRWLQVLGSAREVTEIELTGMIATMGHLAYHLGAIRQINRDTRGPKQSDQPRAVA